MTQSSPTADSARPTADSARRNSQTAILAAAARAAHLIVDREPFIFVDSLAERILGDVADEFIDYHRKHGDHLVLRGARTQAICRARFTEQCVANAADRDITQYVVLGAGLDSFAYRSPLGVRVFEVDHAGTQAWKRDRLAAASIAVPETVTYVPVDFETDDLAAMLISSGFDPTRPAVISWLGVTMYLTHAAIKQTLDVLGSFAPGTELIADHMVPEQLRDDEGQAYVDLVGPNIAERGEPWLTFLAPNAMADLLREHGFTASRHLWQRDIGAPETEARSLWDRTDALTPARLTVITHATRG